MSLIDEIQLSETQRLIESGNLIRQRKVDAAAAALPDWAKAPWLFSGYRARVRLFSCACGCKTETLESLSVLERKEVSTNPTREIPFDLQKPVHLIPDAPREVVFSHETTTICPTCLLSNGFDF